MLTYYCYYLQFYQHPIFASDRWAGIQKSMCAEILQLIMFSHIYTTGLIKSMFLLLLRVSFSHFNYRIFFHICTINIKICLFGTDDSISLQPAWCHVSFCCWQTAGSVDREAEYKSMELLWIENYCSYGNVSNTTPTLFITSASWHEKKVLCNTNFLSNTHHFCPVPPIRSVQDPVVNQA